MIAAYAEVVFGYCEGWVPVRALAEQGAPDQPPHTPFLEADRDLAARLAVQAAWAAEAGMALFVVPGTVAAPGEAKAEDVAQTQVVLVDLDHGDIARQAGASRPPPRQRPASRWPPAASPPRASASSTSTGSSASPPRARTSPPSAGCATRSPAKVGGDPSFRSAHQPIRVAGSVHAKTGIAAAGRDPGGERRASTTCGELAAASSRCRRSTAWAAIRLGVRLQRRRGRARCGHRAVRPAGPRGRCRRHHPLRRAVAGHRLLDPPLPRGPRHPGPGLGRDRRLQRGAHRPALARRPPAPGGRAALAARRAPRRARSSPRRATAAAAATPPLPVGFTEDALALDFTARHAEDWRYVAVWGQWLAWTGTPLASARRRCAPTTSRAWSAATPRARCTNGKIKARISAAGTVAAVERLARSDRRHAATSEIWDRDPWLLNTPGGVVDLRSGAIKPHDRALAMTKIAGAGAGRRLPDLARGSWRRSPAATPSCRPTWRAWSATA